MPTAEQLGELIADVIPCEHIDVHGPDQVHFQALIVSDSFADKPMVRRHQLVYKALGDRMKEEVHALSMRTLTPEEWRQEGDGHASGD